MSSAKDRLKAHDLRHDLYRIIRELIAGSIPRSAAGRERAGEHQAFYLSSVSQRKGAGQKGSDFSTRWSTGLFEPLEARELRVRQTPTTRAWGILYSAHW
jgi:hypothetical protein